ncbi:transporter substrate-binding domain-containing protein [Marinitoga arctica]
MKKKIIVIYMLFFAVMVFSIKIGIYYNPPKIIDSKTGIFPEILNYIFDKENIKYEYKSDIFSNLIKKLDNGEIDAIACVGYSTERSKKYEFNNKSFLSDWAVVYINKNNKDIVNIFDLENKKIGVLKNDIYYEDDEYGIKRKLENFDIKSTFVEFYTYEEIFKALSENKIDVGIVNRTFGLLKSKEYSVIPTDIIFSPIKLLIMFRKDYKEKEKIIKLIDSNLKRLKENKSSIYYEILNKYLYVERISEIPEWVKLFLYTSLFVFIVFIVDHYILIKLVEKRTKELRRMNIILNVKNDELESLNEQIVAQNEELESLYISNERLKNSLKAMIKIVSDIGKSEYVAEENYVTKLIETFRFIVPYFEYIEFGKENIVLLKFGELRDNLEIINLNLDFYGVLDYYVKLGIVKDKVELEEIHEFLESFKTLAYTYYKIKNEAKIEELFREDIIKSLISFLELHDEYTKNHSKNVAELSKKIAEKMNLDKETQKKVYWAALLHDIGKLIIPIEILNKKSKLSDEEYNKIKMHPIYGYNALIKAKSLRDIAIGVRHHHERWDGKGYPDGLKAEEIPLIAQIISVADAWDAMRSKRAYRNILSEDYAISEIKRNAGKQFSPKIVEIFLKIITEE